MSVSTETRLAEAERERDDLAKQLRVAKYNLGLAKSAQFDAENDAGDGEQLLRAWRACHGRELFLATSAPRDLIERTDAWLAKKEQADE